MSAFWQHYLNPLHIFCRLRELGLPKKLSIFLCRYYERSIFIPFLANKANLKMAEARVNKVEPLSNGSWLK